MLLVVKDGPTNASGGLNRAGHATIISDSWKRQSDNVNELQGQEKNQRFLVSSSHNEYSNNEITNNFVAWKHGTVVAAVLSRAQL